jgi:hypothetical protein
VGARKPVLTLQRKLKPSNGDRRDEDLPVTAEPTSE